MKQKLSPEHTWRQKTCRLKEASPVLWSLGAPTFFGVCVGFFFFLEKQT